MGLSRKQRAQLKLIGRNIRTLRRKRELTCAALAEAACIPEATLRIYENGRAIMRVEELVRFAKALRVSPSKLYT